LTRYLLIRSADGKDELVEESLLPLEAELHEALTRHPELLPAEDLGLGRTVVVGRESALASGYADLLLLDQRGQLCFVEVKKEGNADTRRVIAQLIDYAAGLWGMTLGDFEERVLLPYLRSSGRDASSLRDFVGEEFAAGADPAEEDEQALAILSALEASLQTGQFVLVAAAPSIPESVQRGMAYLNSQGFRLYGLEVSYFDGPAKCFVPRLVVQPPVTASVSSVRLRERGAWDEDSLLQVIRERHGSEPAATVEALLEWARQSRLRLAFGTGSQWVSVMPGLDDETGYLFPFALWSGKTAGIEIEFQSMMRYPQKPFDELEKRNELQRRLNELAGVSIPDDRLEKRPSFPLAVILNAQVRQRFLEIVEWAFDEARRARSGGFTRPI